MSKGLCGQIYDEIECVNKKIEERKEKFKTWVEKIKEEDMNLMVGESQEMPIFTGSDIYSSKITYKGIKDSNIIIKCKICWIPFRLKYPKSTERIKISYNLFSVVKATPEELNLKWLGNYKNSQFHSSLD